MAFNQRTDTGADDIDGYHPKCNLTFPWFLMKQRRTRKSRYSIICFLSATECSGRSFSTASKAFTQGANREVSCPTGSLHEEDSPALLIALLMAFSVFAKT